MRPPTSALGSSGLHSWIMSGGVERAPTWSIQSRISRVIGLLALSLAAHVVSNPVCADIVPKTQDGVPFLPIPTFEEVGLPPFTMPTGTPTDETSTPATGGAPTGSGAAGSSSALDTMQTRSWGYAAAASAESMGVNPSALAATCVIESNCQNVAARAGSTVSGVFQMTNGTYTTDINRAVADNPSLAATIVPGLAGKMDPATQAIAAAQELKTAARSLQANDIANPTALDVRGYYNFGAAYGTKLAQASDDQIMSSILTRYTASQLAANGIIPTTTVAQWRQSVASKMGEAAYQRVLL